MAQLKYIIDVALSKFNYMNHTERLLYGFEPNAKERLEDLQREHDFETFEVEPPMSKPYDPNFIEDYQEQPEREYYDEQLNKSLSQNSGVSASPENSPTSVDSDPQS